METIGRYHVVRPLGAGGMGTVFLAHDPVLERDVALKVLHRDKVQSTLHEEAKALAALSHPGIVTVFEIGVHEDQDFIAMEYLPGRTLRQVLADGASRAERIAILRSVAVAVGAAHRAGILHRDIKPENVVVGDDGNVKVVDFGIARRLTMPHALPRASTARELIDVLRRTLPPEMIMGGTDTEVSAGTETMYGTPAYMAPEVLVGEEPTAASDIYSLGVVLFECLSGQRPHAGGTLVEMIAQVVEGDAPPLADPLGPLVAEMLARDPRHRPSLPTIGAALEPPPIIIQAPPAPRPPRRRWPIIALASLGVLAVAGLVMWQLRPASSEPAVAPTPPLATISIAVAPFAIAMPSYGREPPHERFVADTLVGLLDDVEGAHVKGISAADRDAARRSGASYFVTGTLNEEQGKLHARLVVMALASGQVIAQPDAVRPSAEFAKVLDQLAADIARAIDPRATLADHNPVRATRYTEIGKQFSDTGRFTDARPYFEQAVDSDPKNYEAWYGLALVLSWMDADEDSILAATTQAQATAPAGPEHELMRGVALFIDGDYPGARAVLEPLDQPGTADLREVLYYLGEANWHDGRFDIGFRYFKRTLEINPKFGPATVHPMQYALVHRNAKDAQYFVGVARESSDWVELAVGHYTALLDSRSARIRMWGYLLLDRKLPPDVTIANDFDGRTLNIALAAAAGDREGARRQFASLWAELVIGHTPTQTANLYFDLELLGEVVLTAAMTDETRQIISFLAERSKRRPIRGYQRFSMLAAGLLGEPSLILTTRVSERDAALGEASRAELAGDHTKAAQILIALVANPSATWDVPERGALIRNLRAIHRKKDLATLCADTLKPPVIRAAFLVVRELCRKKP